MKLRDALILTAGLAGVATVTTAIVLLTLARPPVASAPDLDSPDAIEVPHEATVYFVGDIMLARGVELLMATEGVDAPLADFDAPWTDADAVVGNFEGTIRETVFQEISHMTFDTPPKNAAMLVDHGFTHLSLSNNHGDDYGYDVAEFTRETIADLGMTPFGDPYDSPSHVVRETWGGIDVSLIGWHAFNEELEPTLDAIEKENADGRFVIVYPHWGPEYVTTPHAEAEVYPAHLMVDAGADLIIGSHPHVIQEIETYNGVPIIYSLGNFLFDQGWSIPTQQGLMAKVVITDNDIAFTFMGVNVNKKATRMTDEETVAVLEPLGIPTTLSVPRP